MLGDDLGRYALVIVSHQLSRLYYIDAVWTEANIIAVIDGPDAEGREAAWSGFFWAAHMPDQELYRRLKPLLIRIPLERRRTKKSYDVTLGTMLLAGWRSIDPSTGSRYVSNDEMSELLLDCDDELRSRILWHVEKWATENEKAGDSGEQADQAEEFLRNVWPRQLSIRTQAASAALLSIAFSRSDSFPRFAVLIQPLLSKISKRHLLPVHPPGRGAILNKYPKELFGLIQTVIPDDVDDWPYDVGEALDKLVDADPSLAADERMKELQRRWNGR